MVAIARQRYDIRDTSGARVVELSGGSLAESECCIHRNATGSSAPDNRSYPNLQLGQTGYSLRCADEPGIKTIASTQYRVRNVSASGRTRRCLTRIQRYGPFRLSGSATACSVAGNVHAITIAIQEWTTSVPVGDRGRVLLLLRNEFPIVHLQVKFGPQVIGEQGGTDLRDSAGMYFSVPRIPGIYNLTVFAQDSTGCTEETTLPRTVTIP